MASPGQQFSILRRFALAPTASGVSICASAHGFGRVIRGSRDPDLLIERDHDTLLTSSATEPHRDYSWHMRTSRTSTALFFIPAREMCFYRDTL